MKPVFILIYLICSVGFLSSTPQFSADEEQFSQKENAIRILEEQTILYQTGNMSDTTYIDIIDSLTFLFNSEAIFFTQREMQHLLKTFEKIVWGNPDFHYLQRLYYFILLDNAQLAGRGGESIYYAEKVSEYDSLSSEQVPIIELAVKLDFYSEHKNFDKVIDLYKQAQSYIATIPSRLQSGSITDSNAESCINLLAIAIDAYHEIRDSAGAKNAILLAENISESLLPKLRDLPGPRNTVLFYIYSIKYGQAMLLEQRSIARAYLAKIQQILDRNEGPKGDLNFIKISLTQSFVTYHLKFQNIDSAAFYLTEWEKLPSVSNETPYKIQTMKANIYRQRGELKKAFAIMENAIKEQDKAHAQLLSDLDDILYSYTESEFNKKELQRVQKEKRLRNLWLLVISLLFTIITGIINFRMRREKKKSERQIMALNDMVNFQIAMMEENKNRIIKEQQESLEQELHDGLTSTVADIIQRIELSLHTTKDNNLKQELSEIRYYTGEVYHSIRSKNHSWVNNTHNTYVRSFTDRIQKVIENALPDTKYIKVIEIDPNAIAHIDFNKRMEMIRIIQEALANIIKHAKANVVNILLDERDHAFILSIGDNGKGFDASKINGLGIQSIKQRVQKFNGQFYIQSGKKGTELLIELPKD
ncbi:sensor histidine kinase [Membranihabitans maritimus]|uniref:sensor histidine kinase n=1 Tax=Membranihabitans maritimus TaxID=2904244 RepID=UPI001F442EDC|nr:ATP-binding protein [Membranihabitans maritimus]